MASKVVIQIQDDGTVKINAREMVGTEAEMIAELTDLATTVGGELVVEKHEPGVHHHHHHHGHGRGHSHQH